MFAINRGSAPPCVAVAVALWVSEPVGVPVVEIGLAQVMFAGTVALLVKTTSAHCRGKGQRQFQGMDQIREERKALTW
jgi:hypothetical protein